MKRVLVLAAALVITLGACGGDEGRSTTPTGGVGERVEIADFAFSPDTLTVAVGTTVSWENTDGLPHTTQSEGGVWDSGTLNSDGEFSFTFDEAGTYTYFCGIHPFMTGTVVVR